MAFNLGGMGGSFNSGSISELPEIETEALGFHAIAGDAKVQLLPAWPADALPAPTSSLLSAASKRGLLAAGGPTSVVIARTEVVREAFKQADGGNIKAFTPELTIELGTRISQVAFSSDESILAISAAQGGGLAVYEVDNLLQNNTQTAFELGTAQVSVRALVPNPEIAASFALVLDNGQLVLADMAAKQISNPLKDGVSCVAWSNKGKQLVAGLSDGTIVQMTPTGDVKGQIPKPSGIEEASHVSAISWLSNDEFFVIHTPTSGTDQMSAASTFHIILRQKGTMNCEFKKLPEVVGCWGLERYPAAQYVQRLKEFPPDLKDVLIIASTASEETGLVTRSGKPLSSEGIASQTKDIFTTTRISNDGRRAALPMADDMTNSSPTGMVLDLSSRASVHRPLPAEEMDESPTPLPALLILNNMGVLAGWWFTYADSIRSGTGYPGLAAVSNQATQQTQTTSAFGGSSASGQPSFASNPFAASTGTAPGSSINSATTGFGSTVGRNMETSSSSSFGQPNATNSSQATFGAPSSLAPAKLSFGTPKAMGGGTQAPTFGSTSGIGSRSSPWGGAASGLTGGAKFGQASFGSTSAIGNNVSPWAAAGSGATNPTTSGPIFGQPSAATSAPQSTFGSNNGTASAGGFASFANSGGFASAAKGPSIFGTQTGGSAFGAPADSTSVFGNNASNSSATSAFGQPSESGSLFGAKPGKTTASASGTLFGNNSFTLDSPWKNPNPEKPVLKAQETSGNSFFGNGFGQALSNASNEPSQAKSKEEDMEDEVVESVEKSASAISPPTAKETTTPAETPAPSKFSTAPPIGTGLFGTQAQQKITPAAVQTSVPAPPLSTPTITTDSPTDLPLPPDTTSKATFTPATSSAASTDSAFKATPEIASSLSPAAQPPPSDTSEGTSTVTPIANEPVNSPQVTGKENDAPLPPDFISRKSSTTVQTRSSPSIFASAVSKPETRVSAETAKPFFSSQPDENELGTTDEEREDEENEDEDDEEHEWEDGEDDEEDEEQDEEDNEADEEREETEGSGVDIANELSPKMTPKASAESSFGRQSSGLTETSWSNVQVPQQKTPQGQQNPFGGVRFLPKQPDNERSPSPERRMPPVLLRAEASRSVSTPNMVGRQKMNLPRSMQAAPKPAVSFEHRQEQERRRLTHEAAQRRAQEEQPLNEDDEDDNIRRMLQTPFESTTELEQFVTHHDYTAPVSKVGVPGQIERVYRDINSMVDTIGVNCRNIQAFTSGHEEGFKGDRELEDLKDSKHWTLVEVQDLAKLENELQGTLNHARVHNTSTLLDSIQRLQAQVSKILVQQKELNKIAEAQLEDATDDEQHRDLDLMPEQSVQRKNLRTKISQFQEQLATAEEAISTLRIKLVSVGSRNGTAQKAPTAEAVEKTIRSMTKMVDAKSSDLDLIEQQLRRMNIQPDASPAGSRNGSRAGSPFMTPPSSTQRNRASLLASSIGINGGSPLRNGWHASRGLGNSINSVASEWGGERIPRAKKMSEFTEEDIQPFRKRAQRKKVVMELLRDAIVGKDGERSVKVVPLD